MEPSMPSKTASYEFWTVGVCRCGGEVCFMILDGEKPAGQRKCLCCQAEGADVVLRGEIR